MKVLIEPYTDEMGVYWRIIDFEKRTIVDDGFASTADAEMECNDKNYELIEKI